MDIHSRGLLLPLGPTPASPLLDVTVRLRSAPFAFAVCLFRSITTDTGDFDYPLVFAYNATNTGVVGSGSGDGVQVGLRFAVGLSSVAP